MKTIQGQQFYRPMEIAEQRLIQNSRGPKASITGNYNFILELIKSGRLKATNYSNSTKRSFWLVSAEEIERYNKSLTEVK